MTATTGAQALIQTMLDADIDTCFANPGTSEMHFVAAMDAAGSRMRSVLTLFEGVATGAADGYFRMAERPASTLLHLGPGLANGLANLHNAKKAASGVLNIVGDHATSHADLEAPLATDVEAIARPMSNWVRRSQSPQNVGADGAQAAAAAAGSQGQGGIATLILPADVSWSTGASVAPPVGASLSKPLDPARIGTAARALAKGPAALVLGGVALRGEQLECAGRIARRIGCALFVENLTARMARGAGRVAVQRIPYAMEAARAALAPFDEVVVIGTHPPVGFFAYPGKRSILTAPQAGVHLLAGPRDDVAGALLALEEALNARASTPARNALQVPAEPAGPICAAGIAQALAATLPEDAIVIDESVTTGRLFGPALNTARAHDYLNSCGGAIGFGLPLALGAALGAPGRRVVALEGDGSAMYTPQALWSIAREQLPVTVVVFANRSYEILRGEFAAVGAGAMGESASRLFSLQAPSIDWPTLARSMGVQACSVSTLEQLSRQLRHGFASAEPCLIEVQMQEGV